MAENQFTDDCNHARKAIKAIAATVKDLKLRAMNDPYAVIDAGSDRGEMIANATLTYRLLEDASMRLGKAIQACDGGVSVYDKATTVGAPDVVAATEGPSGLIPMNRTAGGAPVYGGAEEMGDNSSTQEAGGLMATTDEAWPVDSQGHAPIGG